MGCVGTEEVGGGSVASVGEEEGVGGGLERFVVSSVDVSAIGGSAGGFEHAAADIQIAITSKTIV